MLKMTGAFALTSLCFLGFSGALVGESVELLTLSSPNQTPTHLPLAVPLPPHRVKSVSSSVLEAETWLRIHVLSHYPASRITHIAVGHNLLCSHTKLVLPCLKNLYYSLTRWGLQNEIKLSPSVSSHCLNPQSPMADDLMRPLLEFIQITNSSFVINPFQTSSETSTEVDLLKKLGSFDIKLILHAQKQRKLSSLVDPYPARPTPLPELSPSSSPIHISFPTNIAKSPLPPLMGAASPVEPPVFLPAPPPFGGFSQPPCNPSPAPAPVVIGEEKLWCVAKPSVPVDTLQEAMDFACGEGGADCGEIQPDGSCYNPDTVIAHASYAFNSYWQKNKRNGGSCGFGGTAMIINADPSFMNCRFVVS